VGNNGTINKTMSRPRSGRDEREGRRAREKREESYRVLREGVEIATRELFEKSSDL
jgi:hypothetical protein